MGWKIVGEIDKELEKCIFIVIPHTSWVDFFVGLFTRGIIGVELNWLGKKELFGFPLGWYFRYMGGAPLDRKGGLNMVDSIAQVFEKRKIRMSDYDDLISNLLKTDAGWSSLDSAWKFITFENGIVTHITTMNTL